MFQSGQEVLEWGGLIASVSVTEKIRRFSSESQEIKAKGASQDSLELNANGEEDSGDAEYSRKHPESREQNSPKDNVRFLALSVGPGKIQPKVPKISHKDAIRDGFNGDSDGDSGHKWHSCLQTLE